MDTWVKKELYGWGRHPRLVAEVARPERQREVVADLAYRDGKPVLAHGLGRSYGDVALLENGRVILTRRLDRMLDFDPVSGWLKCEAGVSIQEIIETFLPRGYFLPVVPGTWFVTVGGAIGNDIHGKSHHVDGTFCDHVRTIELLTASGEIVRCSATEEPELFWATVGGIGLTGIILTAEVRLIPVAGPWIVQEAVRCENLAHFFEESGKSAAFTHTVTWIDCVTQGKALGRGILQRGGHAPAGVEGHEGALGKLKAGLSPFLQVPMDGPNWLLNTATIRLFNEAYFHKQPKGQSNSVIHYQPFFFPLDFVKDWNRVYGDRGFLQYQLVVPPDPEHRIIRQVLETITASGMGSFLAVIKEFGDQVHSGLSFPRPGVTLALDFAHQGQPLLDLCNRLDDIVSDAGGRVYLGKDARLSMTHFRRQYPEWETWRAVKDRWDPNQVFQSALGQRLGLCGGGK